MDKHPSNLKPGEEMTMGHFRVYRTAPDMFVIWFGIGGTRLMERGATFAQAQSRLQSRIDEHAKLMRTAAANFVMITQL